MSDNVKVGIRHAIYDAVATATMGEAQSATRIALDYLAERGMVVLGPDGEPRRVVELLSTIRSCFDEVAEHVDLSDDAYLIGLVAGLGEAIAEVEG